MHVLPDDISVIQRVLRGESSAYAILVERYQAYVFTLTLRYVNNRETAEELAQDIFVKAYRSLADFKGNSKFSTWLYTIVNTTCLTHLRGRKADVLLLEEKDIINVVNNSHAETIPANHDIKITKKILQEAIAQLPEMDAQILYLFYLAEQSVDEISEITGATGGTVKVRLFRARQKLKDILERRYKRELS